MSHGRGERDLSARIETQTSAPSWMLLPVIGPGIKSELLFVEDNSINQDGRIPNIIQLDFIEKQDALYDPWEASFNMRVPAHTRRRISWNGLRKTCRIVRQTHAISRPPKCCAPS
jgi:hypothetical protein